MDKTKIVDSIIASKTAGWSEAERPVLMAMNEAQLTTIQKGAITVAPAPAAPAPAPVTNAQPAPAPAPAPAVAPPAPVTTTTNAAPQAPQTMEQYIASAPAPIREVLNQSIASYNAEKTQLIENITKNPRNVFTKEDLGNRPLGELRGLAALAAQGPAQNQVMGGYPNYAGMAPAPVENAAGDEECLVMPSSAPAPTK
jgi:hypothetical protein